MTTPDKINATDDPQLAKANGLTEWDEERQQYVAPAEPVADDASESKTTAKGTPSKATGAGAKSTK